MRAKFAVSILIVAIAVASTAVVLFLMSTNSTIIGGGGGGGGGPILHDDTLSVELVAEGLDLPTSMHFLDDDTVLVLEKNKGQVRVVLDGKLLEEPAVQVDVATGPEQGLLGIAIWNGKKKDDTTSSVFLYMTEKNYQENTRNLVYKYFYDENEKRLENKTVILDLPGEPGPFHNGGKITIGPYDGYIYAVIGDVSAGGGMLDNQIPGKPPDDKSVILRVDRDTGTALKDNPFFYNNNNHTGDMERLQSYYAYGIRNSFGMDFDPVTGKLWISENGDDVYDEINIVEPGFNSGWHKIMGPIERTNMTVENDLIMFDGAYYEDPVFSWYAPVGVTDIEFFNSTKLGDKYDRNLFVGDINYGNLYFFEVNGDRTGVTFQDPRLFDLVADPVKEEGEDSELSSLILGEDFGRITDIETGPDGLLYILTYEDGKIYRITNGVS
jgi:aldose sugar dehydrogenase